MSNRSRSKPRGDLALTWRRAYKLGPLAQAPSKKLASDALHTHFLSVKVPKVRTHKIESAIYVHQMGLGISKNLQGTRKKQSPIQSSTWKLHLLARDKNTQQKWLSNLVNMINWPKPLVPCLGIPIIVFLANNILFFFFFFFFLKDGMKCMVIVTPIPLAWTLLWFIILVIIPAHLH